MTSIGVLVAAVTLAGAGCGAERGEAAEPVAVAPAAVERDDEPAQAEPEEQPTVAAVRCPQGEAPETGWTCSMHPRVRVGEPGHCPVCGMELVEDQRTSPLTADAPPDVAAVPDYARTLPSGLATCVVRPGDGARHPTPTDTVTVEYVGWGTDGESFDSSLQRGRPASFRLDRLIDGWTEGIPLMVEGEIRRLWIPGELAYGNDPVPGRPHGMLVFDIELVSIDGP